MKVFARMRSGAWSKSRSGLSQLRLDGTLENFQETWPRAGVLRADAVCLVRPSAPRGAVSEWPTPRAQSALATGPSRIGDKEDLQTKVLRATWPTPQAHDDIQGSMKKKSVMKTLGLTDEDLSGGPRVFTRLNLGGAAQLWPTPVAQDDGKSPEAHMRMKGRMKGGPRRKATSLTVTVKGVERGMWPTPTVQDAKHGTFTDWQKRGRGYKSELYQAVHLWATPGSHPRLAYPTSRWPTPTESFGRRGGKVQPESNHDTERAFREADPTMVGGQLNPTWVEWLMGYPLGWTIVVPTERKKKCPPKGRSRKS